jgi:putative oxidoreductase
MNERKTTSLGLLFLRVIFGVILLYYGIQKVFPVFAGQGFNATLEGLMKGTGAPAWLATMAIVAESAGALAIIVGLFTRLASFGILCTMAMAAYTHFDEASLFAPQTMAPFFFPVTIATAALVLVITGAGDWSFDAAIAKKMDKATKKK